MSIRGLAVSIRGLASIINGNCAQLSPWLVRGCPSARHGDGTDITVRSPGEQGISHSFERRLVRAFILSHLVLSLYVNGA